jgi:acyl carrier protein phosphodiesterase
MRANLGRSWASLVICLILGLGAGYGLAAFIVYQPQVTKLQTILIATESVLAVVQSEKTILDANYSRLSDRYSTLQTSYNGLSLNHSKLQSDYSALNSRYNQLSSSYSSLDEQYDTLDSRWDTIFQTIQSNYVSSTFIYYTGYGESFNIMNIQIPYDTYK